MLFKLLKILSKFSGMLYITHTLREQLALHIKALQQTINSKTKQIKCMIIWGILLVILFSMALRFLLLGCACWLNEILSSAYLGFFIIALVCFLMVIGIILRIAL